MVIDRDGDRGFRVALRRLGLLAPVVAIATSCVVGAEEEPGCHSDAECGGGACRSGACFAVGPGSTPVDPLLDGGDADAHDASEHADGDAATDDSGDSGDAADAG